MRVITMAVLVIFALLNTACDRAHSNMQTVITNDCGVSWELIRVGQTVPARVGPCAYKVTVPDYPMQGETRFKTSFANRVLADVEVSYDYSITDGIMFIGEAKYIGKANTSGDDAVNAAGLYETAENSVIDKRIREVATTVLIAEDIVDFSQAEFEDKLLLAVNKVLESKGVKLNFLSFVPIPEEQTRLAIDMMTAMKIYDSKGLHNLGQQVAVAKAGAARINFAASSESVSPKKN
ncbi:MAG: hypothetical protein AAB552_04065 [Patescibacteria group bacterium]